MSMSRSSLSISNKTPSFYSDLSRQLKALARSVLYAEARMFGTLSRDGSKARRRGRRPLVIFAETKIMWLSEDNSFNLKADPVMPVGRMAFLVMVMRFNRMRFSECTCVLGRESAHPELTWSWRRWCVSCIIIQSFGRKSEEREHPTLCCCAVMFTTQNGACGPRLLPVVQ